MTSPAPDAPPLQKCLSDEDIKLLDTIDNLGKLGLQTQIDLPQLIVCGNQSSGKSSVLEAISGIPFPRKDGICTRFPTKVILRKGSHLRIEATIIPNVRRSEDEKAKIQKFKESLTDFAGLPDLIEKVKVVMGIESTTTVLCSDDVLQLKVSGPTRPFLTMVDLPGLIYATEDEFGGKSREHINEMVRTYMKNPRSIILAVVAADSDLGLQGTTGIAKSYDSRGTRTLGIITKPDKLDEGSEQESEIFKLAHNQRDGLHYQLGWHVLKNRGFTAEKDSSAERNSKEEQFFSSKTIWKKADKDVIGIATLAPRLTDVLLEKIKDELPNIIDELAKKIQQCDDELEKFGPAREKEKEQRQYLAKASDSFISIIKDAVNGSYDSAFFEDEAAGAGYDKRLCAIMAKIKGDFNDAMTERGQKRIILDTTNIGTRDKRFVTRSDFLKHVADLLEKNRGKELPGMFNPLLVTTLFKEQAEPWKDIILEHTENAHRATRIFLQLAVAAVAPKSVEKQLMKLLLDPFLEEQQKDMKTSAAQLLEAYYYSHPTTLNDTFTAVVQRKRFQRYSEIIEGCFRENAKEKGVSLDLKGEISLKLENVIHGVADAFMRQHQNDMNAFACSEILDYTEAYYEIALPRMIDDVAAQVIELSLSSLTQKLGDVFSPTSVSNMDPDLLRNIAAESSRVQDERNELTQRLKLLEKALELCSPYRGRTPIKLPDQDQADRSAVYGDKNTDTDSGVDLTSNDPGSPI